ncbi:MAG TPA: DUF4388 domain-containing protein [Ktedonosporobacter sp.]|nr:DUF4388 domain-containing protein [Ktedonosporobacter sp.]
MSQRRGTITNQLANIIQVIQLGKKTGVLTVERGDGADRVLGEIHFTHGQITQAYSGSLAGQQAFNWLSTWGECRFTFIPLTNGSTPQTPPPSLPSTQPLQQAHPYPPVAPGPPYNGQAHTTGRLTGNFPTTSAHPRRIRLGDETLRLLEHAGLSRLHRHLFLLIDGQRSRAELVRLIGRRQDEVQLLLDDLERIGVIQQ